jgi:hypothetical protein
MCGNMDSNFTFADRIVETEVRKAIPEHTFATA